MCFHGPGGLEFDFAFDQLIAELAGLDHNRLAIASDLCPVPSEDHLERV